jgi:deoxyguanosine kinase
MKYICIEGPTGIGKTTLAKMLYGFFRDSHIFLESFEDNPFLNDYYRKGNFFFETELSFLLIHYHQLSMAMGSNNSVLISDYFIEKDLCFGEVFIQNQNELTVLKNVYSCLSEKIIKPDLIICLSASNELIYERIKSRNRDFEKSISFDFVNKLNKGYEIFFNDLKKRFTTISIDMNTNNFIEDSLLITRLNDQIISEVMKND